MLRRPIRFLVVLLTTLIWSLSLLSVAGAEEPGLVAETVNDAGAATETEGIVAPRVATQPLGSVLYDNGPFVTNVGGGPGGTDLSVLQNTSLGMTIFGFGNNNAANIRMADNFTVTSPGGWSVDSFVFYNYQTGSTTTSTMTGVVVRIWDGPPNAGGTVVFGDITTNRMASTAWTNAYRVTEDAQTGTTRPIMANSVTAGTVLPPGDYWVEWGTTGSLASGPWSVPVTVIGQTVTGDALQFNGTWGPALDGTFPQGVAFQVIGTAIAGAPDISVSQTVGTDSSACATTDVITVTAGSTVYYCYEVTNTGDITLTRHDLDDSELGTILADFPFTLVPSGTAFITASTPITMTTVSTATWTAYNPGPTDVVTATDSVTVVVQVVTAVTMAGLDATKAGLPLAGWLVAGAVAVGAGLTLAYRRRRS